MDYGLKSVFIVLELLAWVASDEVILGNWPKTSDVVELKWNPLRGSNGAPGWIRSSSQSTWPVCDVSSFTKPNSWLRSDPLLIKEANMVYITVEYSMKRCSFLQQDGGVGPHCKDSFDLHVNQSEDDQSAPDPRTDLDAYAKIGNLSLPSNVANEQKTIKYFPLRIKGKYILLAFRDQGSCSTLYSVKVAYNVCPKVTLNKTLVSLQETVAPASDAESIRVEGGCESSTVQVSGSLNVSCESNGEWNISELVGKCVCKEGMENKGVKCENCPDGEFNNKRGFNCTVCPANSLSESDRKSCKCNETFYRAPWEDITDECTTLPSAPRNTTASFVNQSTVVLEWSPPDDTGGRNDVYYDVECRRPCEEDCVDRPCRNDVVYIPDNKRLIATKVTVTNLFSSVNYTFRIYAKNGVSETAVGIKTEFTSLDVRTNGSVPGIPEVSVDWLTESLVARVSWTLQLKNGVIKEYHVTHTREDDWSDGQSTITQGTSVDIQELDAGKTYNFEVFAVNQFGKGPPGVKTFKVPNGATDTVYIVMIVTSVIGTLLLIILVVIAVYFLRKRFFMNNAKRPRTENSRVSDPRKSFEDKKSAAVEMETVVGKQNDAFYMEIDEAASFEIGRDKLEFQKLLGKGSFGEVFKAVLEREIVAVKCLKETATPKDRQDMLTELNVMKKLEPHPHVVKLIGCCSCNGPLLIVLEYLPYGDLLGYLRKSRGHEDNYNTGEKAPTSKLNATDLLSFAWMIADGMKYLAKMQVVHRDLAARNVLVGENKVCKISDFGLARDVNAEIYVRQSKARLPVKWMPPESLFRGESSTMSDVWSYAILLWEIFTIGDSPYPGIKANRVASLLQTGYRMPRPIHISEELFAIMSECWSEKPEDRPTFQWLSTAVKRLLKDKKTYVNLDAYKDEDYVNFDMFDGQK